MSDVKYKNETYPIRLNNIMNKVDEANVDISNPMKSIGQWSQALEA